MENLNYQKLFIGGDLSGIQKFLYNITSKAAAVSLKGRSYSLKEYMDSLSETLSNAIQASGSPKPRIIYCSGGKFYMIAENTEECRTTINKVLSEARKSLWEKHMGQLGISISYVPFTENEDGTVNVDGKKKLAPGILWEIVNKDFANQKVQKFKELLLENYDSFFNSIPVGGKPKVCAVTGVESPDCVLLNIEKNDGGEKEQIYVLPSVKEQIDKGRECNLKEETKTFEKYADGSYLGILRMDIDGLGKRFIKGFKSINEYETFSNRLKDFFEEETRNIRMEEEFRNYINIIYAGGDDLFVVGRWDKTIDFAERIHNETTNRFDDEGLTISGGVAIVKPKFPIAKAAEMAGEAEYLAKSFYNENGEKNAFHMFGKTISWNGEYKKVKEYRDVFYRLIRKKGMSRSILHKIMLYASISDNNKYKESRDEELNYRYIWHMPYYITRFMERYKDEEIRSFCIRLRNKEVGVPRNLELLAVSARWAELLIKYDITVVL